MRLLTCALLAVVTISLTALPARANPKSFTLSGSIKGAAGYSVLLVQRDGTTISVPVSGNGSFRFKKVRSAALKNASLQLVNSEGRFAGPIVLRSKGAKASITFSGKPPKTPAIALGKVTLKSGYATLKRNQLTPNLTSKPLISAPGGKPIGAGELGLVAASAAASQQFAVAVTENPPGADSDQDGVLDAFDADDDGDLILDASDVDSRGADIPYTGLVFDMRKTLNAHVRSGLSDEAIDAVIGGENVFALTFFFSLSSEQGSVDGGHVVCSDSLVYCRRSTPTAFYGGVSESTDAFRNRPWSELLTSDGYPRMERISVGGMPAIVASIQPRVGRAQFRPGDVYQVNLTSGTSVVSTRSLALAPYFVSIPALKEYDAGAGNVTVDYAAVTPTSGSIPGITGNPIALSPDGDLTLSFWRPQRQALRSTETGYYDWGNLNYGVVIDQAQATCAGLYSQVSGDLTENPNALGAGNSPLAQQGAVLSPLRDVQGDRAANAANVVRLTVNLKQCAARAGLGVGTYNISLRAAGETVTGGEVSAVQSFSVQIQ
jgi:hypothetical protein